MLDRKEMEREKDLLLPVRLHPPQFPEPPNIALHVGKQVLQIRVHREIFHVHPTLPGKVLNTASSVLQVTFCSETSHCHSLTPFWGFQMSSHWLHWREICSLGMQDATSVHPKHLQ